MIWVAIEARIGQEIYDVFLPAVLTYDLLIGSYSNYITSFSLCLNPEISELLSYV